MNTYQYIDTQGQMRETQAADAGTAMRMAQDIGANSGVMLKNPPQTVQSTQDIRTEGMSNSIKLDSANTVQQDKSQGIYSTPEFREKLQNIEDGGESNYIMNTIIPQMEQTRARMQGTSNRLIQNIEETFANRITEMAETNRKQLQYEESTGLRTSTGRSRYAPVMQRQILTDEEQRGILRISTLETQMNELIIKAEQARDENDIMMLNQMMDAYTKAYTQTQNAIKDLYNTTKQEEEARIKQMQEERNQLQAEFKLQTDKAKALAPTLSTYTKGLPQAQQEQFVAQYAAQMGLDPEILYGALQDYSIDAQGKELSNQQKLQSMSIQRQSNARASEKHQKDMNKVDDWEYSMDALMQGAMQLSDVPSNQTSKVRATMADLGYYKDAVPSWFVDIAQEEAGGVSMPIKRLEEMWKEHKTKIGVSTGE